MNQQEFIKKAVTSALIREGYTETQARIYARDAVLFYQSSTSFKNGAYADCLAYAKNLAKNVSKKDI